MTRIGNITRENDTVSNLFLFPEKGKRSFFRSNTIKPSSVELTEEKLKEIGINSEVAKIQSAVVRIRSTDIWGMASGFVFTPNGYILTNNHVALHFENCRLLADFPVLENSKLPVKITPDYIDKDINLPAPGREIKVFPVPVKVVVRWPKNDLALLAITLPEGEDPWPYVHLLDIEPKHGEYVYSFGHRYGKRHVFVSAGQIVHCFSGRKKTHSSIQGDCGDSGGLLCDENGNALGILTGGFSKLLTILTKIKVRIINKRPVDFPIRTIARSIGTNEIIRFLESLSIKVSDVLDGKPLKFSNEIERIFD